jgi:nucleotide-binding universal stress UspA family protein
MKVIVVGYDGSDAAKRALERAAAAGSEGAEVIVVSAVPAQAGGGRMVGVRVVDPHDVADHREELREAQALLEAKGIQPRLVEAHGDPAERIVEVASENDAELIVVGGRGLGAVRGALLGSVSIKVVREAACDVLVVR